MILTIQGKPTVNTPAEDANPLQIANKAYVDSHSGGGGVVRPVGLTPEQLDEVANNTGSHLNGEVYICSENNVDYPTYLKGHIYKLDIDGNAFEDITPIYAIQKTYAELVALRNDGLLEKERWYRMTDYVTKVNFSYARSAEHQFDLLLYAREANLFDETAAACIHEGDTYFTPEMHLERWSIKYSLDNDDTRFDWVTDVNYTLRKDIVLPTTDFHVDRVKYYNGIYYAIDFTKNYIHYSSDKINWSTYASDYAQDLVVKDLIYPELGEDANGLLILYQGPSYIQVEAFYGVDFTNPRVHRSLVSGSVLEFSMNRGSLIIPIFVNDILENGTNEFFYFPIDDITLGYGGEIMVDLHKYTYPGNYTKTKYFGESIGTYALNFGSNILTKLIDNGGGAFTAVATTLSFIGGWSELVYDDTTNKLVAIAQGNSTINIIDLASGVVTEATLPTNSSSGFQKPKAAFKDGKLVVGGINSTDLYTSSDLGATWTKIYTTLGHVNSMFIDGANIVASDNTTLLNITFEPSSCNGVIYEMEDDKNNKACYDFKNVMFDYTNQDNWAYTFNFAPGNPNLAPIDNSLLDASTHDNIIECDRSSGRLNLSYNVFLDARGCYKNTVGKNSARNVFLGRNSYGNNLGIKNNSNSFGTSCHNNTLGMSAVSNVFGSGSYNNVLGNSCARNNFGSGFIGNTIGNFATDNTGGNGLGNVIGHYFQNNTIGYSWSYNNIGNSVKNCTFGQSCANNTFGSNITGIIFGKSNLSNIVGNGCQTITHEDNCSFNNYKGNNKTMLLIKNSNYNEFGIGTGTFTGTAAIIYNTFGANCKTITGSLSYNKFGDSCQKITLENPSQYNVFGNNCNNIAIFKANKNIFADSVNNVVSNVEMRFNKILFACSSLTFNSPNAIDRFQNLLIQGYFWGVDFSNNPSVINASKVVYIVDDGVTESILNEEPVNYQNVITYQYQDEKMLGFVTKDGGLTWEDYEVSGSGGVSIIPITWSDLKSLRDAGTLVPGQKYKIVDYTTTTTQADTQSAGHDFDIVVTALSTNELSEIASCVKKLDDTYFENAKLEAWEIKYCIDNDTTRFAWALDKTIKVIKCYEHEGDVYMHIRCPEEDVDGKFAWAYTNVDNSRDLDSFSITEFLKDVDRADLGFTSTEEIIPGETIFEYQGYSSPVIDYIEMTGKGIIYRMKDEWNNECPYDFKNIQFKKSNVFLYTFGGTTDNSLTGDCHHNIMMYCTGYYSEYDIYIPTLNFNTFGSNCSYNVFGHDCDSNKFGNNCNNNTFGNNCGANTFGNNCNNNTFGNICNTNTFGYDCGSNTFGYNCGSNTFGYNCGSNTFGNTCGGNTFGNNCNANMFNENYRFNTSGNNCSYNVFGNECQFNTFGNNYGSNTFGNSCYYNKFGNYCNYNTFGNYCSYNNFYVETSGITKKDYIRYIILEDGCRYNNFYSTLRTSNINYLQRIRIKGLENTTPTDIQITLSETGTKYEWVICYTSGNVLKQYCPDDNLTNNDTYKLEDTGVLTTDWAISAKYDDFGYQAQIDIDDLTESDFVNVVFGVNDAISGNYAPAIEQYEGHILVFSKVNTAITIPTIAVTKID